MSARDEDGDRSVIFDATQILPSDDDLPEDQSQSRMKATLIKVDGTTRELGEKMPSLRQMYEAIGCTMVELVRFPWGEMWADEEGLLKELRVINRHATRIMQAEYGPETGIVGNVIVRVCKGYVYDAKQGVVRKDG